MQVYPKDLMPFLDGCLYNRLVGPDSRITDQDVDSAEVLQPLFDHACNLVSICHVSQERQGADTKSLAFFSHGFEFALIGTGIQDQVRPLTPKSQRNSFANVAAGAVDQGSLAT